MLETQEQNQNTETLYAVAYRVRRCRNRRWLWTDGEIVYTKALNPASAKIRIINSMNERIKIVACGPAIGFFVEDKEGKILSAD